LSVLIDDAAAIYRMLAASRSSSCGMFAPVTNNTTLSPLDKGAYSILKRFGERRYNQFGAGLSVMTLIRATLTQALQQR
jgi:hypothetical protein